MTELKTIFTLSAGAAARAIRRIVEADRDHLVVLDEDFFAGTFRETFVWKGRELPILPYSCKLFRIDENRRLVFNADGDNEPDVDGATYCPDKIGDIDLAPGYISHDKLYDEMKRMAESPEWKAAGWTEPAVRRLADIVLGKMVEREEQREKPERRPWISRVVYGACRAFGGLYHRLSRCFGAAVVALALALGAAGCAGCAAIPDDVFDPSDEIPVYHVIQRTNAAPAAAVAEEVPEE